MTDGLLDGASVDYVHVNNDFPVFASDHEPVVATFTLPAAPGDGTIVGTGGNDTLEGTDAGEVLDGLDGNDVYIGGGGADVFVVGALPDLDEVLDFQVDIDRIDVTEWGTQSFEDLQFFVRGNIVAFIDVDTRDQARLTITEGSFADLDASDFIFAPVVNDTVTLTGTEGNDRLFGGEEDNVLDGLGGSDFYIGAGGSDIFVFSADQGMGDRDVARDFTDGEDLLDVSNWGVTALDQLDIQEQSGRIILTSGDNMAFLFSSNLADPIAVDDLTEDDFIFSDAL